MSEEPPVALDPRRLLEQALELMNSAEEGRPAATSASAIAEAFPELEIRGLIDRGGAGAVYEALDPKSGRICALKLLPAELAGDPAFAERFQREAESLAALEHENIVAVHGFGERDGLCYVLTERIDGTDLRRTLNLGRLRPAEALRIALQVAAALRFAHERQIVHRDIKPENILIDQKGLVRLADFGLAKLQDEHPAAVALTRTGVAVGTPHYMAPEQLGGLQVDGRADLYALGVVLYEMLTGRLPLGRFPLPSAVLGTGRTLDRIVERTLALAPEDRYANVAELERNLQKAAQGLPEGEAAKPSRSRTLMRWAFRAMVALFALILFVALVEGEEEAAPLFLFLILAVGGTFWFRRRRRKKRERLA